MAPVFKDGDSLRVQPLAGSPPLPGEVVVALRGTRLVTHRLVESADGVAVTKGDACPAADPPVPADAMLARVVGVRRGGKAGFAARQLRRAFAWALRRQ